MSAVDRLAEKLSEMGVVRFNVFKGPGWNDLTVEERAEVILESIKAIESGDVEEVTFDDAMHIELRD